MPSRLLFFAAGLIAGLSATAVILAAYGPAAEVRGVSFEPVDAGGPAPTVTGLATARLLPRDKSQDAVSAPGPVTLLDVVPAVVRVQSSTTAGSGIVIDATGRMLTSAHIVGDDHRVYVQLYGSDQVVGTVTRIDRGLDLALVELPAGTYVPARLGDEDDVVWGASVVAIGYALNMPGPPTLTTGVISRVFDQPDRGRQIVQTDAAINLGSSGGPLLDSHGKVIGMADAVVGQYKSFPANGISYAVSIKTIREEFLEPGGE